MEWKMLVYILVYDHLEYFTAIAAIMYILCPFGNIFSALVFCTKKNLATLVTGIVFAWEHIGREIESARV
jgi:hypothetical protein